MPRLWLFTALLSTCLFALLLASSESQPNTNHGKISITKSTKSDALIKGKQNPTLSLTVEHLRDSTTECSAPTMLSVCFVLVGTNLSTTSSSLSVSTQASLLDSYISAAYISATSSGGSGWQSPSGPSPIKFKASSACENAFSSYYCINPAILSLYSLTMSMCGDPSTVTPCYQRCWNFQTACMGMTAANAASACQTTNYGAGMNTNFNTDCFCGDNFPYSGSPYDVCSGDCSTHSECGKCPLITEMSTCYVLVGTSLSTTAISASPQTQAFALDAFVTTAYAQATSKAGWTWKGTTIKVTASAACKNAFSSYFCMNPLVLAAYNVSGACGVSSPVVFTPCYHRCLAYQTACLGLPMTSAGSACDTSASASPAWNSAADENCYCADNFPYSGSLYDDCDGPCDPQSECGSCPSIVEMSTCNVLVGTALSSTSVDALAQSEAFTLDSFVLNAYEQASTPAGWSWEGQTITVTPSAECLRAFSSYFCMNPIVLNTFNLSGSCGVSSPVIFTPCYQRCFDFQYFCTGASKKQADTTCASSVVTGLNTASNANCYCADNSPTSGSPYDDCSGNCDPQSECTAALYEECPSPATMNTCYVLVGTKLGSTVSGVSALYSAIEVDNFITEAFASAIGAGWKWNGVTYQFQNTNACKSAFSSYFCMNPIVLSQFHLNGSCGVSSPVSFLPCYQRCWNFQTACMGKTSSQANTACQANAKTGWNTASNSDCYCADNFPYSGSPYDVCSGSCNSQSECGSCPSITEMSTCYVLVGTSLSTTAISASPQTQAFALDAFVTTAYAQATSKAGWTWKGTTIKVTASAACKNAFSSYFCMNPLVLAAYNVSGACGVSSPVVFTPCYHRCLAYQTACLGLPMTSAGSACDTSASASPAWNSAADENCYCADNFPYSGSPYDDCDGPCDPQSECGSCPTIVGMDTCYVLVGTALSSFDNRSLAQAAAYEVDKFVAEAYANASTSAGWNFVGQQITVTPSPECLRAFSSYLCMNPVALGLFSLNGSCGVTPPVVFTPCYDRCFNFFSICLGYPPSMAESACLGYAQMEFNTELNANCYCADNSPTSGSPYDDCSGLCEPFSECPVRNSVFVKIASRHFWD